MKQYYLIEKNHFDSITEKCATDNKIEKSKLDVLNDKKLSDENVIKIFNSLQNKESNKEIKKQMNEKKIEDLSKKADEPNWDFFINSFPMSLRNVCEELIGKLRSINDVRIDKHGYLTVKKMMKSARLEDILRIFLIKNSSIKKYEDIIKYLVEDVPNNLIINQKVMVLKEEANDSESSFKSSFGAGIKKKKRKYGVLKGVKWTHFEG